MMVASKFVPPSDGLFCYVIENVLSDHKVSYIWDLQQDRNLSAHAFHWAIITMINSYWLLTRLELFI